MVPLDITKRLVSYLKRHTALDFCNAPVRNIQFNGLDIYTTIGIVRCTFDLGIVSIMTKPYILQKILNNEFVANVLRNNMGSKKNQPPIGPLIEKKIQIGISTSKFLI